MGKHRNERLSNLQAHHAGIKPRLYYTTKNHISVQLVIVITKP